MPSEGSPGEQGSRFPHFLCRVSALPAAHVHALRAPECARLLDALHDAGARLDAERQAVQRRPARAREQAQDPELRRTLLNLRRDLYNLRLPAAPRLDAARAALPSDVRGQVDAFAALLPRCCGRATRRSPRSPTRTAARRRRRAPLPGAARRRAVPARAADLQ